MGLAFILTFIFLRIIHNIWRCYELIAPDASLYIRPTSVKDFFGLLNEGVTPPYLLPTLVNVLNIGSLSLH